MAYAAALPQAEGEGRLKVASGDAQPMRIGETDWNDKTAVATLARKLWTDADKNRSGFREKVFRNIEYVAGNQWHQWSDDRQQMVPNQSMASWQSKIVYNRIRIALEMKLSRILEREHVWRVPSQTDDQNDRVVARLSDDLMDALWAEVIKMPDKMQKALACCMTTGVVWFKPYWNPQKGIPVTVSVQQIADEMTANMPPDPQGMQAAFAQAQAQFAEMYPDDAETGTHEDMTGDPDVDWIPPLDVICWPWDILSFDDAQVFMVVHRRTVGEIADKYGMTMDEVREIQQPPKEQDWQRDSSLARSYDNGRYSNAVNVDSERNQDIVYEFELYTPFTIGGFKRGRCAVVLGYQEEAQSLEDIPEPYTGVPLYPLMEMPVEGKLYGTCTVDQMIPAQREINTAAAQKADYRNRKIFPTVVRIDGDGLDETGLTNAPGAWLKVQDKSSIPEVLEMPDIGLQHDRDIAIAIEQANDISGTSGVDLGAAEQDNAKSGRAIMALGNNNDRRIRPFAQRIDIVMSKVGTDVLALEQAFAADERTLHLVGENQRLASVIFSADKIRPSTYGQPGANPSRVICQSFQALPTDTSEKWAMIQGLMGTNPPLLDPVKDRGRILKALGFGDLRSEFDADKEHEAKATYENDQWRDGSLVGPPSKADNDLVHIEIHDQFIMSEDYKQLVQTNPQAVMDLTQHRDLHEVSAIQKSIKAEYTSRIADFKQWLESQQSADMIQPGLGAQLFPAPMMQMMAAPPTEGGEDSGNQSEGGPPPSVA